MDIIFSVLLFCFSRIQKSVCPTGCITYFTLVMLFLVQSCHKEIRFVIVLRRRRDVPRTKNDLRNTQLNKTDRCMVACKLVVMICLAEIQRCFVMVIESNKACVLF
jgi:hypothetical protein